MSFLLPISRQYGDVVEYLLLGRRLFLVVAPAAVRQVLVENSANYSIFVPSRQKLSLVLGEGLFTSEGDHWLRQRRLMQPVFYQCYVERFSVIMTDLTLKLSEQWQEAVDRGQVLDPFDEMARLALQIAAQSLFSADVSREASALGQAVTTMIEAYGYWLRSAFLLPAALLRYGFKGFQSALSTLDGTVYRIIEERRQRSDPPPDLLSLLMAARDEETGAGMSAQQLRDEVLTLLIAGHETTASGLAWVWYALAKHPHVRQQLDRELMTVLGGRVPTVADLPHLPYARMVVQEVLRLYPPAWTTFRIPLRDDVIDSYHIPAGSRVTLSPYVTHRHPDYWPDPERFDPERFTEDQVAARPKFAYFPFGGGPRQCIGQHFALMEMQLVLATLAQQFHLDLVPGPLVVPEARLTLRARNGMKMTVRRVG